MAASLYKLSDLAQRWVSKKIWMTTWEWVADPVTGGGGGGGVPNDPIGGVNPPTYGWIGYPHSRYGVIDGMTLRVISLGPDPNPPYTVRYFSYWA